MAGADDEELAKRSEAARTRLALERTLMAWIRTSVAMIAFGFTIFHLFGRAGRGLGTEAFALALIGVGLAGMVVATIQHVAHYSRLSSTRVLEGEVRLLSASVVVAVLVCALGILALMATVR